MMDRSLQEESAIARRLLVEYAAKGSRTEKDWSPILEAYQGSAHRYVWELEFAIDPGLYRALEKARTKMDAEHSLDTWKQASQADQSPGLMRMIVMLCLTQTQARDEALRSRGDFPPGVYERLEIWEDVFSGEATFVAALQEGIASMFQVHRKIHADIDVAHPPLDPSQFTARTFSVPALCRAQAVGSHDEDASSPFEGVPEPVLARMNAFAAEYMQMTHFSVHEDGLRWLVHQSSTLEEPVHRAELAKQLNGCWGEYLQGLGALVGSQEVKPGWDVSGIRFEGEPPTSRPKTARP